MAPSSDGIHELIEVLDKKYTDGHARHSKLFEGVADRMDAIEQRVEVLERDLSLAKQTMETLERRKVEINNVRFTPTMVLALLGLCASIVGGQKLATWGLAEQQKDTNNAIALINVQLEAQKQLQDERSANVQRQVTQISGQVTMIDTKLSNLREVVAGAVRK